jgi:hypothetical protein
MPELQLLSLKSEEGRKVAKFTVTQPSTERIEVDFLNSGDFFKYRTSSPAIVISLPKNYIQKLHDESDRNVSDTTYKTDGYYNSIEQTLEKALIKRGFSVIDRSKLEALLRKSGEERHLANISELLLIAMGSLNIDYVLQINSASLQKSDQLDVDLLRDPINRAEIESLDSALPGLHLDHSYSVPIGEKNSISNLPAFPTMLTLSGYQFKINAKIINVYSGNIDWIGSLSSDSLNLERRYKFQLKSVRSSRKALNSDINSYNSRLKAEHTELQKSFGELQKLYVEGQREVSPFELRYYSDSVKDEFTEKRRKFQVNLQKFNSLKESIPENIDSNETHSYLVDLLEVAPSPESDSQRVIEIGINRLISTVGSN